MSPQTLSGRLDRWIHGLFPADPRSLGIYRMLVGGYFVFFVARVVRFPAFPGSFFAPPLGPFRLVTAPPPSAFFVVLSIAMSVSAVALMLGYRTTAASVATGLLGFLGDGFVFSFGKIDHNTTALFMVPIIMAASGWGSRYSLDATRGKLPRPLAAWPTSLLALLLGAMMFSAGLPKALTGWLNPATHATEGHFILNYLSGRHEFLAPYVLHVHNGLLWKLLDGATLLLELGFLVAILSRTSLRLFCAAAVLFHTAILLSMNIDFTGNVIAYAAFVDWPAVARNLRMPRLEGGLRRVPRWLTVDPGAGAVVVGVGLLVATATLAGGGSILALCLRPVGLDPLVATLFIYVPASLLAVAYVAWVGRHAIARRHRAHHGVMQPG